MSDTDRFLAVHTLRIKGLASADDLAEITGVADLGPMLEQLIAEELVKLRTGRVGGYALTKAGREAHPELVEARVTEAERAGAEAIYQAFLPASPATRRGSRQLSSGSRRATPQPSPAR